LSSSVNVPTGYKLGARGIGVWLPTGAKIFPFHTAFRWAVRSMLKFIFTFLLWHRVDTNFRKNYLLPSSWSKSGSGCQNLCRHVCTEGATGRGERLWSPAHGLYNLTSYHTRFDPDDVSSIFVRNVHMWLQCWIVSQCRILTVIKTWQIIAV
jgi:hypothetical protein